MNPVREQLSNLLAFPLWSHVSASVYRREVHPLVANKVPRYLSIRVPWIPILLDRPVKHPYPSASPIRRHSPVRIARVKQHLVPVLLHDLVYPERALVLIGVLVAHEVAALLPCLHVIRDVQRLPHVLAVRVVREVVAQERVRRGLQKGIGDFIQGPRRVLFEGVASFVCLELISYLNGAGTFGIGGALLEEEVVSRDYWSEEVVPVKAVPKIVDLVPSVIANGFVGRWVKIIKVVDAFVVLVGIEEGLLYQVEVIHHIGERGRNIYVPLSCTVAYDETFEVQSSLGLPNFNLLVVLMYLPSEIWGVDAPVALSRNVEIIEKILGETFEPV